MLATGAGKEKEKSEKKIFFTIVSNSAEGEKKKKRVGMVSGLIGK